jgi:hypothetical protein
VTDFVPNVGAPGTANSSGPAAKTPSTVPDGTDGLSITCEVKPAGDGFDIQLDAKQPGPQEIVITGHVNSQSGTADVQFVSIQFGNYEDSQCTLSYNNCRTVNGSVSAGQISGCVTCPNAASKTGLEIKTADGGSSPATCLGQADFVFQNCSDGS